MRLPALFSSASSDKNPDLACFNIQVPGPGQVPHLGLCPLTGTPAGLQPSRELDLVSSGLEPPPQPARPPSRQGRTPPACPRGSGGLEGGGDPGSRVPRPPGPPRSQGSSAGGPVEAVRAAPPPPGSRMAESGFRAPAPAGCRTRNELAAEDAAGVQRKTSVPFPIQCRQLAFVIMLA